MVKCGNDGCDNCLIFRHLRGYGDQPGKRLYGLRFAGHHPKQYRPGRGNHAIGDRFDLHLGDGDAHSERRR